MNGRLPLGNLYAAGQSALLPGALGTMTSAFLVARELMDKETYGKLLQGGLCR